MAGGHRRAEGLSPRVRGNPELAVMERGRHRSIPACAGEPAFAFAIPGWRRVYPRVCGGTACRTRARALSRGLSPRVRGNPGRGGRRGGAGGSIPACAGEPILRLRQPGMPSVYPRVCGGTGTTTYKKGEDDGLSPRVRGNPQAAAMAKDSRGSIPACAGEPWAGTRRTKRWPVYPRVCGGTRNEALDCLVLAGLSPRVRGNRTAGGCSHAAAGSIPACAGEPTRPC